MKTSKTVHLPIVWKVDENITTQYVTDIVVQHTDGEFIMMFFEAKPPLLFGSEEDIQEQLEANPDLSVINDCVARLVLSPHRMQTFIAALQQNMKHYQLTIASEADEEADEMEPETE